MNRYFPIVTVILSLSVFVCLVGAGGTWAATLGSKSVKLLVASAPGGAEDMSARALAPLLQQKLNTTVSVENNPGAGGKMAFEKLQKADPDGRTLAVYTFPKSIILEYMSKTNYRTRDFTPIYAWSKTWPLLVVHIDSAWKTFDEFVKAAKAKPLAGGVSNLGGVIHLVSLIVMDDLGVKVNWVPYHSSAESLTALAGKHLDFVIALTGSASPLLDAGKIRPLLLFSEQRDPYVPNVPIPKELGFGLPSVPSIHCAMAAPNTPVPVAKTLERAFVTATEDPVFVDFMKRRKMTVDPVTSENLGKMVKDLYPRIEKIAPALQGK